MHISKNSYIKALESKSVLNERRLLVLNAIYSCPNHKASPAVISHKTGKNIHFVNLIFGSLAKAIAKDLNIERNSTKFNSSDWWPVISTGENKVDGFNWKLRKNFVTALEELNLINNDHYFPDEANIKALKHLEGGLKRVPVNAFERSRAAREECIRIHGVTCKVCNINFEKMYGNLGKGFIHVHHKVRISTRGGKKYKINPATDLQPVCPNCHAMIHRGDKELSIVQLRKIIKYKF